MVQTTHISNLNGMGTFAYAAPELLTGGKCNEVADIFSFGVLLWELVTGEMPRRGKLRDLRLGSCQQHHAYCLQKSRSRRLVVWPAASETTSANSISGMCADLLDRGGGLNCLSSMLALAALTDPAVIEMCA